MPGFYGLRGRVGIGGRGGMRDGEWRIDLRREGGEEGGELGWRDCEGWF